MLDIWGVGPRERRVSVLGVVHAGPQSGDAVAGHGGHPSLVLELGGIPRKEAAGSRPGTPAPTEAATAAAISAGPGAGSQRPTSRSHLGWLFRGLQSPWSPEPRPRRPRSGARARGLAALARLPRGHVEWGGRNPMTHARRSSRPARHGVTWHGRRSLITRRPGPGRSSRPAPPPRRVLLSKMAAPGALPPRPPPPPPL